MRPNRQAPWVICALAATLLIATAGTLSADDKKVPVNECVAYDQDDLDDGLSIRLASSCQVDLRCEIRWSLTCEGDKPKKEVSVFGLIADTSHKVEASAAACGEAGWQIDGVSWSCRPQK
jgi:hypothetical protein